MTSSIKNDYKLDAGDVKALRTCESVAFDFDNVIENARVSQIRAMIDKNDKRPFDDTRYILVDSYLDVYPHDYAPKARACEVLLYSHHSEEWQTIAKMLKPGDIIRLEWVSNQPNNSGINSCYGQAAVCTLKGYEGQALHFDDLGLKIIRNDKVYAAFNVKYSITPNNSASMIKVF